MNWTHIELLMSASLVRVPQDNSLTPMRMLSGGGGEGADGGVVCAQADSRKPIGR